MTRWLVTLCAALWLALPVAAQDPLVELDFDAEATVVVGQPVALRLTVLVPTFMPRPPALPSFETPDLMVRLSGRATNPTSRRIDGETWSGITRSYSLYPMVPGRFDLPPLEVAITYMGTDSAEQSARVSTPAVSFAATAPEGAEALDPLLIATGLSATQTITAPEGGIGVGDAIARRVEITVEGTSPLFLPPLLGPVTGGQLRAYPSDPTLSEADNRGTLSGTRTESASYIALAEGTATLPALTLDWFNLGTGAVETITLEGTTFEVAPGPEAPRDWDGAMLARLALGIVALGLLTAACLRYVLPPARAWLRSRRAARRRGAPAMYRRIASAVAARDLTGTLSALGDYRVDHGSGAGTPGLDAALDAVAADRYGPAPSAPAETEAHWTAVARALPEVRTGPRAATSTALPPLNPPWRRGRQSPV